VLEDGMDHRILRGRLLLPASSGRKYLAQLGTVR
jgi:hypothetical protein